MKKIKSICFIDGVCFFRQCGRFCDGNLLRCSDLHTSYLVILDTHPIQLYKTRPKYCALKIARDEDPSNMQNKRNMKDKRLSIVQKMDQKPL